MDDLATSLVRVAAWSTYSWLVHGFSTRAGGDSTVYGPGELNLGMTEEDDRARVLEHRVRLAKAVGGERTDLLELVRQVHGVEIRQLTESGGPLVDGDGMMTNTPGLLLAVQAADCVPVLIADVRQRVVMALHAGWRGTVSGMTRIGVGRLMSRYESRAEDLVAAIGPSIGPCCYQVGEEVWNRFDERQAGGAEFFDAREGGLHLNLWEANRRQLLLAGLSDSQVTVIGECTSCARVAGRRKYFSHRAEGGRTGRGMGVIGVRG